MGVVRERQYFTATGEPDGPPKIKILKPGSGRFIFNKEANYSQSGISDDVKKGKGRVVEPVTVKVERIIDGSHRHGIYRGEEIKQRRFTHELPERRTLFVFPRRARRDVIKFVPYTLRARR